MKVLNLYACLGGNRYKWNEVDPNIQVTAVELDPELARLYKERFPDDDVIIADAHQYLLDHYKEFDFIWSSPPCQSHSKTNHFTQYIRKTPVYPNMNLYEEIIFLRYFCKSKWVIENVIPYYDPLIIGKKIGRHMFWSNFNIPIISVKENTIGTMMKEYRNTEKHALNKSYSQRQAVNSDLAKHIFEAACGIIRKSDTKQIELF